MSNITPMAEVILIDLGFIGHQAESLQTLFAEYSATPNEFGYYTRFENYSKYVFNQGVLVNTNCFEDEEHFRGILLSRLLSSWGREKSKLSTK